MNLYRVYGPLFPYFGGKSKIADDVWGYLGDVDNYVEPFAGSAAVFFSRPEGTVWGNKVETINDIDCLLVNAYRAIQYDPYGVYRFCNWPVSEMDCMAFQIWLVKYAIPELKARIPADMEFFNSRAAGYFIYGLSLWIGSGFADGSGPWTEEDGLIVYRPRGGGATRKLPHLICPGKGINKDALQNKADRDDDDSEAQAYGAGAYPPQLDAPGHRDPRPEPEAGVKWQRPRLSSPGQGIYKGALVEADGWGAAAGEGGEADGVQRQRPELRNAGYGVHKINLRPEPGDGARKHLPFLAGAGQGIYKGALVEADGWGAAAGEGGEADGVHDEPDEAAVSGVHKKRPDLISNAGVHKLSLQLCHSAGFNLAGGKPRSRFAGNASRRLSALMKMESGRVHRPSPEILEVISHHPLFQYIQWISQRLRYARITCGDWQRVLTPAALIHGDSVGIFLDPPYGVEDRDTIYNFDSRGIAGDVLRWCYEWGQNERYRIVLCGYDGEYDLLLEHGWRKKNWVANRAFGSSNPQTRNARNRFREAIYISPHCLRPESEARQLSLF